MQTRATNKFNRLSEEDKKKQLKEYEKENAKQEVILEKVLECREKGFGIILTKEDSKALEQSCFSDKLLKCSEFLATELDIDPDFSNVFIEDNLKIVKELEIEDFEVFSIVSKEAFAKYFMFVKEIPYSVENETLICAVLDETLIRFLERYFEKVEGHSFSYDKATHCRNKIIQAMIKKEKQNLYSEYDFGDGLVVAYWSPKSVSDTEQLIKKFLDWYNFV